MELLSQNEIAKQKSQERMLEVTEGAKLANRVDSLRQVSAEEDLRLSIFRNESIAQVQVQIDGKVNELNLIVSDIESRKAELEGLMQPLDSAWEAVRSQQSLADDYSLSNEKKNVELSRRDQSVSVREREAERQEARQADIRIQLQEIADKADSLRMKAIQELAEAQEKKAQYDIEHSDRANALDARERKLATREIDVLNTKSNNENARRELVEKERFINDKYETLQRAIAQKK